MLVCYDFTGNAYYGRESSGFCGSVGGAYTEARDEVTCPECISGRAYLSGSAATYSFSAGKAERVKELLAELRRVANATGGPAVRGALARAQAADEAYCQWLSHPASFGEVLARRVAASSAPEAEGWALVGEVAA